MTDYTPSPEAVEAVLATRAFFFGAEFGIPADGVRRAAKAAVAAAGPIIEQAVREQIAADIQRVRNEPWLVDCDVRYAGYYTGVRAGMESAASIARGEGA